MYDDLHTGQPDVCGNRWQGRNQRFQNTVSRLMSQDKLDLHGRPENGTTKV